MCVCVCVCVCVCRTSCVWLELTCICLCLFTGQVTLTVNQNPEDVPIVVTEGDNVTFQCSIPSAVIILSVRLPGQTIFVTDLPANVMRVGSNDVATITVTNAQRSENSTAFQCGSGGQTTNTGVLNVYCKLYSLDEENERERN